MRLLNVGTMKMEEFFDEMVPPYAILSHRWSGEEVSLQEWHRVEALEVKIFNITREPAFGRARHPNDYLHDSLQKKYGRFATEKGMITSKSGYSKILSCCKLVRKQRIYVETQDHLCRYVWIDTCCIDKTNNAELSEAINSMFRWYQKSLVCFVHLADVHANLGQRKIEHEFRNSSWFKRGWTLQELLASCVIKFFDEDWEYLFDREHQACLISDITRIDEDILTGSKRLSDACSAEKMSWAASRTTTRKEDIAYCLLGIFDVNMPLLYGEGDKAFVRLQEEIIRQSGDPSIFAWGYNVPMVYENCGVFARSPVEFIGCSELRKKHNLLTVMSITNVTLSVHLRYYRPKSEELRFIYADLECFVPGGKSIFLPLVFGGSYLDASHLVNADGDDFTSSWFERRAGARPILIDDMKDPHKFVDVPQSWIQDTSAISIMKKNPEGLGFLDEISLRGLNFQASQGIMNAASLQNIMDKAPLQVVVDEVYPPHFSNTVSSLHMGEPTSWYPGYVERKTGYHGYNSVSYLRISCWNRYSKKSELAVMVHRSMKLDVPPEMDIEVRLSKWPHSKCVSLADCTLGGHTRDEHMGLIPNLGPGVEGKEFGDFIVEHTSDSISFFAPGEADGKSGKVTGGSEGRGEERMVEEAEVTYVEEAGSDGSENSGDLGGVHCLFDQSRTTATGLPSRNDTKISQTKASIRDTQAAENDSGGVQGNEEGDGKNKEDSDNLGIMGLFQ